MTAVGGRETYARAAAELEGPLRRDVNEEKPAVNRCGALAGVWRARFIRVDRAHRCSDYHAGKNKNREPRAGATPGAGDGRRSMPPGQPLTSICRGRVSSRRGSLTVSRPFSYVAFTAAASIEDGNVKVRLKAPWPRSTR
jgi:hypothetical protein